MVKIMKIIGNMKKGFWIFLAIFLIGTFLRTYNFSDWLRFNMDQSRDAALIENLSKNNDFPELGPKTGGTDFKLGPAFYYFQLASAKIFGAEPDKLAYPDLFFSICSILLFFLLAKIYFKPPIALGLAWLYAISYFAVKYSRFAWNPNSTPFFAMLFIYAAYNLAISEKRKVLWAILAGIALGICVQLHTSLLIIMPIFAILTAIALIKEKRIKKNIIIIVIAAVIFTNLPQIMNEFKTGGLNYYNFILGIKNKNGRNSNIGENLLLNLSCHIKSSNFILSSSGNEDECGYKNDLKIFRKLNGKRMTLGGKSAFIALIILSFAFFSIGYAFLFKKTTEESDRNKKLFLKIISGYAILSFLFYIAWANELAIRFFLPLSFIPFLILGFWLDFFSSKSKKGVLIAAVIMIALSASNFQKISHTYRYLKYGGNEIEADFSYMTLGEGKYIIDFIENNSDSRKNYIDAQAGYLFKSFRPLKFLAQKKQLEIIQLEKEMDLGSGEKLFYFRNTKNGCELADNFLEKYEIEKCSIFRQFSIFALKVK